MTDVTVTHADREAAADLIEAYWSGAGERHDEMRKLAQSYRAGHVQGVWAAAFARHRLAERAQIAEWLRERAAPFGCRADREIAHAIERGDYVTSIHAASE